MKNWKCGDIFKWSYKKVDYNSSTQYWCCSQTGVVAKDNYLYDTFWGIGVNNGRRFSIEDVDNKIEIEFVANLDDFELCRKEDFCYYDDKDLLNLSNSNNSGLYYKRIGAEKSLNKMKKILERNVKDAESKLKSAQNSLDWEKQKLEELTIDSHIFARKDVSLGDSCWLDTI